ncbi:MAG: mechanosensitive ion channel [Myxococcales bacterium]|nr:mechanosensitive ion channel [Myxococcales bacterium]MCB9644522.1 mechanosensitive ion channel [Myxococcales bacterium]
MEILTQGLSELVWLAPVSQPTKEKAREVADTLIGQLMSYFHLPAQYTALAEWGLRIAISLLLFLVVAFLARRSRIESLVKWIDDRVGLIELKEVDQRLFAFLISSATWVFGFMVILSVLKLNALLATLGLSAGALATIAALANKEFIGHFFAGFALQARGQVQKGNAIEVMGVSGTLQSIGMTACEIEDYDGVVHFIPNTKMLSEKLTNYSMAKHRRVGFSFTFDPTSNTPQEMEALAKEFLAELTNKKEGKDGSVSFGAPTEKGLEVNIYAYFERDGWSTARSQGHLLLQEKLEAASVEFGLPQQIVYIPSTVEESES